MLQLLKTDLGRLRVVSLAEGTSYLSLVGVGVPLKYLAHRPEAVHVLGRIHGMLFVLFIIALVQVALGIPWRARQALSALLLALLPGGAYLLERMLRRGPS